MLDEGDDAPEWYYVVDGRQQGPVSTLALRRMLRESTLDGDTPVFRNGMPGWRAIASVLPTVEILKPDPTGGPVFFPVGAGKFVAMSVMTWGLYELWWFYRNWKYVRDVGHEKLSPFWRAWFVVFWVYDFASRVKRTAQANGILRSYSAGWVAVAYILLLLSSRLPVVGLISVLTFLPLLPVVGVIGQLNDGAVDRRFSAWDIVGMILGGLLWVLVIAGWFLPAQN